jgi:hypothetical protein
VENVGQTACTAETMSVLVHLHPRRVFFCARKVERPASHEHHQAVAHQPEHEHRNHAGDGSDCATRGRGQRHRGTFTLHDLKTGVLYLSIYPKCPDLRFVFSVHVVVCASHCVRSSGGGNGEIVCVCVCLCLHARNLFVRSRLHGCEPFCRWRAALCQREQA